MRFEIPSPNSDAPFKGHSHSRDIVDKKNVWYRRNIDMPIVLLVFWLALDGTLLIIGWGSQHLFLTLALLFYGQFIVATGLITLGEQGIKTTITAVLAAFLATALLATVSESHFGKIGWCVALQRAFIMTFYTTFFFSLYAVILNLPLVVARIRRWRFCFDPKPQADAIQAYQFTIREILSCTTLVAAVAAVWAGTSQSPILANPLNGSQDPVANLMITAILVAFPIPWSIWTIFFWVRPFHAGLVAIVVTCLWGVVMVRVLGTWPNGASDAPVFLLKIVLIPPGVMIVHMLLLQSAGLRWKRHPAQSAPTSDSVMKDKGPDWQNDDLWRRYGRPGS